MSAIVTRRALIGAALLIPAAAQARDAAAVLAAVNAVRARHGLPALRPDARLDAAAQVHARDLVARGRLDHFGSDGSDAGARIARQGYRWRTFAENLAAGFPDPNVVVARWMDSPGHRANLLHPAVVHAGVARLPATRAGDRYRIYDVLKLAGPQ